MSEMVVLFSMYIRGNYNVLDIGGSSYWIIILGTDTPQDKFVNTVPKRTFACYSLLILSGNRYRIEHYVLPTESMYDLRRGD